MTDLRCEGTLHGRMVDDHTLEVKCGRRSCGHVKGTVILHQFDVRTGQLVRTRKFADPRKDTNGAQQPVAAIRAS